MVERVLTRNLNVEITKYKDLEEKIKDRKEKREKNSYRTKVTYLLICNIEKVKEELEEDSYLIPFKELNKKYLEKK